DLVAAGHGEPFQCLDQLPDAVGAVIDGNDDAERETHGFTAVVRIEPPKGSRMPRSPSQHSNAMTVAKRRSTMRGKSATSLAPCGWVRRWMSMSGKSKLFQ